METQTPYLPQDIEAAVASHHGGPVTVAGQNGNHVVMSMAVFRDMMGVGSDDEFQKSVSALRESIAQTVAGKTISLDEVAHRLTRKYGP